jgi:hypothetical protein
MINWKDFDYKDYCNVKKNEIKNLPNGVNISTMTASIEDTKLIFNFENIFNYLELSENDILAVVRSQTEYRSLIDIKKKKKKTDAKKKKKQFFNQLSVIVRISEDECEDLNKEKKINFKLFVNGSIQMSGIKNITFVNKALNKLIERLSEIKGIKFDNMKSIKKITFAENVENLNTTKFQINMINSNYKLRVKINRSNLYQLLLKKKINVTYEKAIRACVCVKYTIPESVDTSDVKELSIFIFQKGNIIITGKARSKFDIMSAYNFINEIILSHIDELIIYDEEERENNIKRYFNEVMMENSHKLNKIFTNGVIPKLYTI